MDRRVRIVVYVAITAALLFVVGLATRVPAMRLGLNYGLHAVLAAFFYGVVVCAMELKSKSVYPVALGGVLYGLVLGAMGPVMLMAGLVPAAAYFVCYLVSGRFFVEETGSRSEMGAIAGGVTFSTFAYVGTIVGGMLFSGYTPAPVDIAFLLLSGGLGLLGALVGSTVAKKISKTRG